ncbi:alpha/beta fold hydrolase [Cellulomonas carbonis]|uniref:Alpha/beta hydrolase n=1 Tax=Cellulomonas carbonis T26 TaxID=947969 RepID=A0A0A0BUF0_9CELL|nr:alpha/beta hydrolase [Cellulomonas carbonis]KGM11302.1 alpha/beta hydrolase [Cellulomonas carbonis T26]GGC00915.1 hydrolase [Cellulomonas carbonis]
MPHLIAPDGTPLTYRLVGDGEPLVCLAGGPMRDASYLGDLGGLSRHRTLVLLDLRGTGGSGRPDDAASYRCDRQVGDVEALRVALGRERVDVLAHSAGASLALRYLDAHPDRVGTLTLVTPSTRAVGLVPTVEQRLACARLGSGRPGFAEAYAALTAVLTGAATDDDERTAGPLFYGGWDAAAREHHDAQHQQLHPDLAAAFVADGAFDPPAARAALAHHAHPVVVVAGEVDPLSPPVVAEQVAALAAHGSVHVQRGAGHYPWVDDSEAFVATVVGAWAR